MSFKSRLDAGRQLAEKLSKYRNMPDLLVLALPEGGVPVAAEVARTLNADLDVLPVAKLVSPGNRESTVGAIASGGACVLNDNVLRATGLCGSELQSLIDTERDELARRENLYHGARPALPIRDRPIILIDDGLATGATMTVALQALRPLQPESVSVAVPVASMDALLRIADAADEILCLRIPENLLSVGRWYDHFEPVDDADVQRLIELT